MDDVTGELVRAQATALRGVDLGDTRAKEIAADIAKINAALANARDRLEFNDEPARFEALLRSAATTTEKPK